MSDIQFQNMDSWRGSGGNKFGLNFKQIVLMHINRCVVNGSVEWHGGYWQERFQQHWTEKYYVQNSREVFSNSIKILRALLLGYFDKKMEEKDKKLQEKYNEEYEKYSKEKEKTKELKQEWNSFSVEWHTKLFEELIMLSKRLNFFEEESSEEEM